MLLASASLVAWGAEAGRPTRPPCLLPPALSCVRPSPFAFPANQPMTTAKHDPAHRGGRSDGQESPTGEQLGHDSTVKENLAPSSIPSDDLSRSSRTLQPKAKSERHINLAQTLIERAYALNIQYEQTWLLGDLEERILALRAALAILSSGGAGSVETELAPLPQCAANADLLALDLCRYELSIALGDLYKHTGRLADLEEQLQHLQLALESVLDTSMMARPIQRELGAALRLRFMHVGNLDDLWKALELHSHLVDEPSEDDSNRPRLLYELGCTLHASFQVTGEENLTQAVLLLTEAVPQLTESNSCCAIARCTLANALISQHLCGGDVSLLQTAKTIYHDVLCSLPSNHPDRWQPFHNLGGCMGILYEQTNDMAHLNESLECSRRAFGLHAAISHRRPGTALNLANTLSLRYEKLGDIGDLQESIHVLKLNCEVPHRRHFDIVGQLADSLRRRYEAIGAADDLEESIKLLRIVLVAFPQEHPRRCVNVNNLSAALYARYQRDRGVGDILEVIDLLREALLLSHHSNVYGLAVQNLADSLSVRYEDSGDVEMLAEAIALCEGWLVRSRIEELHILGDFLRRYANALALRYDCEHDERDVSTAISLLEEALECQPVGHIARHTTLIELAEVLRRRFEGWKNAEDIDRAMELLTDAFACLPDRHTDRSTCIFKVAQLHLIETTPFFSIGAALEKTRQALTDGDQTAQARLKGVLNVLKTLEQKRSSIEHDPRLQRALLDVYTLSIELLPRVAYFGLDAKSRLQTLAKADELAANGSAHALTLVKPRIAIELLEQGRAVFWLQHLRLRTEFNALPFDLAANLAQTAAVLDRDSNAVINEDSDQTKAAQESEAAKRRRLGDDFEALIRQARALPGFDRFMLPETFQTLSAVAIKGPVVVLLANDVICQAVVIENPDTVHQVHLPEVSLHQLQTLSRIMAVSVHHGRDFLRRRAMKKTGEVSTKKKGEEVLAELWHRIVRKIIDTLKLTRSTGRSRPRVTLCPTGVFVHLPLHAAGLYSKGKAEAAECFSDYLVPSYTPTIGALLNARRQLPFIRASEAQILLAAVSKPFKWSQLPFVTEEVRRVRLAIPSQVAVDFLGDVQCAGIKPGSAPSASAVLDKLPEATILHFACHGHQDSDSPLESGFVMQDQMLTIANLMSLNLDKAFLAFLSACETAKGDKAQPDQAIHLAAAMLFAGFKSVVGTMWSMGDFDGPIVAQTIYEELFHPGAYMLDPETIAYALDSAMRKLRASGLTASRWAPYVHLGV